MTGLLWKVHCLFCRMTGNRDALCTADVKYGYSNGWHNLPGFLKAAGIGASIPQYPKALCLGIPCLPEIARWFTACGCHAGPGA
jgi:hypothetical protein